ncbi:hypothetical protein PM082_011115 [Marasmius tenuissimus]|nr:hypothetical protein PM082_011115 [Marasmius tenuissimus]
MTTTVLPPRRVDINDPELIAEYLVLLGHRSSRRTIRHGDVDNWPPLLNLKIRDLVDLVASSITSNPTDVAAVAISTTSDNATRSLTTKVYFTFNNTDNDGLQRAHNHLKDVHNFLLNVGCSNIPPSPSNCPELVTPEWRRLVHRLHSDSRSSRQKS